MNKIDLEKKWKRFHKRVGLFNHIPFVDFVLAAGSMAMGTAKENSDFDVIVGVRLGRIFTARFFAVILFTLRGWRRKNHSTMDKASAKDKICLNHFVTPDSYRLSPPHNEYWRTLYESLIPMAGHKQAIKEFFEKNNWANLKVKSEKLKVKSFKGSLVRLFLDIILTGKFGDSVEKILKNIQIRKIEKGIMNAPNYKPRIIYSDEELEFHPHTYRIEQYCNNLNIIIKEDVVR